MRGASATPLNTKGNDERLGLDFTYRSLASVLKYDKVIPSYRESPSELTKGIYEPEKELFERVKRTVCPPHAEDGNFKTIECSIMDVADDIAYSTYDLEDTFKAGFLSPLAVVSSSSSLLERVAKKVSSTLGRKISSDDVLHTFVSVFNEVFENSGQYLLKKNSTPDEVAYVVAGFFVSSEQLASNGYLRTQLTSDLVSEFMAGVRVDLNQDNPCMSRVSLEDTTLLKIECLKHFTFEATIMSPRLRVSERRGFDIICKMFKELDSKKGYLLLPEDFQELYDGFENDAERKRVICDFIAGMTDRYAIEFYGRIFSENPQSIFKPF